MLSHVTDNEVMISVFIIVGESFWETFLIPTVVYRSFDGIALSKLK